MLFIITLVILWVTGVFNLRRLTPYVSNSSEMICESCSYGNSAEFTNCSPVQSDPTKQVGCIPVNINNYVCDKCSPKPANLNFTPQDASKRSAAGCNLTPTPWTCYPWSASGNSNGPIHKNECGDVECQSTDGKNCQWGKCPNTTPDSNNNPLVCGAMHKALYGITGYDTPGHWCNVGMSSIQQT